MMETIRPTSFPITHLIHALQVLVLYLVIPPLAMVDEMGWWSVLMTGVIAFTLYGIGAIGR
jgi:putative membrane protein